MKSRYWASLGTVVLLSLTVGACGGNGSSGPAEMADPMMPPVSTEPWPLDAEAARMATGGSTPGFGDDAVGATLDDLTEGADTFLVGDVFVTAQGNTVRGQTACGGETCMSNLSAGSVTLPVRLSLSDLVYVDGDPDTEYQAVAEHRGVSLAQGRGSSQFSGFAIDRYGYGGWLSHSYFVSESGSLTEGPLPGADVEYSFSAGEATGSNPIGGSASWTGVVVGADMDGEDVHRVQGDAEITISDFADPKVGVEFDNIIDLVTETPHLPITWNDVPLVNGGFTTGSTGDFVTGSFYGPNHEEVGGVFEHDEIVGAFGAKRAE